MNKSRINPSNEILREELIKRAGIKDGMTEWDVLLAVDKIIQKRFTYTFDEDLRTDLSMGIVKGKDEQWFSRHVDLIMTKKKVTGDCDDFALSGLEMMSLLGFDQRRIAMALVVDETHMDKGWAGIFQNITHAVGLCYVKSPKGKEREWHYCFDTWGQAVRPSVVPATKRHSLVVLAPVSQGIAFEEAPNSIPYNPDHKRGMKARQL